MASSFDFMNMNSSNTNTTNAFVSSNQPVQSAPLDPFAAPSVSPAVEETATNLGIKKEESHAAVKNLAKNDAWAKGAAFIDLDSLGKNKESNKPSYLQKSGEGKSLYIKTGQTTQSSFTPMATGGPQI